MSLTRLPWLPHEVKIVLFGRRVEMLHPEIERYANLHIVEANPDVVISFGGDGTLLASELKYPGVPKVPILNSRRGHRCIAHPRAEVLRRLSEGTLIAHLYMKLDCTVRRYGESQPVRQVTALNEINVHMGKINSAVRFQLFLNDEPYDDGTEILGDGFVLCTPFGSTAYFRHITRGIFTQGIGIAFKATGEAVDHLVVPEDTVARVLITRGPAVFAYDSAEDYVSLDRGDEIVVRRSEQSATILTCGPVRRLNEPF